jgi:ubiquinone/menaquinone biosynthesis C-methylase UbiE
VVGLDFSEASLSKASRLAHRLGIASVDFEKVDLARLDSPLQTFDFVLCNGVFPCLPRGREVFGDICRSFARPGTYIVLGLYHQWGRLLFRCSRRLAAGLPEIAEDSILEMLVKREADERKLESWLADQLRPPIEVYHRAVQIRSWFEEQRVAWVRSIPALGGGSTGALFSAPVAVGSTWSWRMRELLWAWSLRKSGGYFVVIGRKEAA